MYRSMDSATWRMSIMTTDESVSDAMWSNTSSRNQEAEALASRV